MRHDALTAWQQVADIVRPEAIVRISVRYTNQISRETDQARPGDWLLANDYIPKTVLYSAPGFLSRTQTLLDSDNAFIVLLADIGPTSESKYGAIVLDID